MIFRKPIIVFASLLLAFAANAEIRLPQFVSDHMVLQRETIVNIWGWAEPNESIRVTFQGQEYRTTTPPVGKWSVPIKTGSAGGPHQLHIVGADTTMVIQDILIGDVWLCSGQSNMVHYLGRHSDRYKEEIAKAYYPEIRQFLVPPNPQLIGPAEDLVGGEWTEANPESVLTFSVVAYFFARHVYDRYQVPIGLINASVGGTPIQAWTSEEGLAEFLELQSTIENNKDTAAVNQVNREARTINQNFNRRPVGDKGLTGEVPWYDPAYVPKGWKRINVPGYWEDQGIRDLNGSVWYRREVDIPQQMIGQPARIDLGRIVDADKVYINGQQVGRTTYQYPQRRYEFDAGVLQEGKNVIVAQIQNFGGKGGFIPDKPYYLAVGTDTLDLKGDWYYKVGEAYEPRKLPRGISLQNQPTSLFNGMLAPWTKYPMKGALWYQGESNAGDPQQYEQLVPALITDWRKQWNAPDLPFLYVQLPNFMEVNYLPEESNWAEMRNAQLKALSIPNTAMAVSIELGEWNDIHPGNKKPIGDRLALAARNLVYGEEDLVYSGPVFKSAKVEGNKVILYFDHIGGGLISRDREPLRWFSIAGVDNQFRWAQAEINDDQVTVWHQDIAQPTHVRYAWMDNPDPVNFYNQEGLPASPFEVQLVPDPATLRADARDSINQLTTADHAAMMRQLGLSSLRPGPSGNPNAPNAANSDETKVNDYDLPDPLVFEDGSSVESAKDWRKRRREIRDAFDKEVYGEVPDDMPSVRWKLISEKDTTTGKYPIREKLLAGIVDNSSHPDISVEMELLVAIPAEASGPVPTVLHFGFIEWPFGPQAVEPTNFLFSRHEPDWKSQLIAKGWGYAILVPSSVQADNGAGLREGIIGLANKGKSRTPEQWGALRAWAWGASRVVDYFEQDDNIDAVRVAIEGLSRYGKAALVAMAYEPRISLAFIGSSGAGGAKILRRNFGEQVENLASRSEYHWFCGNFMKYASMLTPSDLPVDAHHLVAMCAPRPVFISAGSPKEEGQWIDAKGMFLAGVHASPVYTLLERKGLRTEDYPVLGMPLIEGDLAWRQHTGGHSTGPNWSTWIAWAARYWDQ